MNRPSVFTSLVFLLLIQLQSKAQDFSFAKPITIVYSSEGPKLDSIAAHLLANDIKMVTGSQSKIIINIEQARGNVIVIGNIASTLVQNIIGKNSLLHKNLHGKWECFGYKIIDKPTSNISKAFVIAGSDTRGTAYGVFSLSQKIGVSPWYWWADVAVKHQSNLVIHQNEFVSSTPSVKYRGIFINDEDWGLRPWAANNFEPAVKNIGPKTYAKVFELLLRLKANFIWPAMHPGTAAFYSVPGNKEVAGMYNIVIGSSHAEPMLRNNVGEWNEKTMGNFNYITNKEKIDQYWESRVKETSGNNVVYTMGMRGVHDGQMEGVKSAKEAVPLLEKIIDEQRSLLKKYQQKDIASIPQAFTPYKEVLDFYDNGLKVPDDITLVWPDDNYGYIERLNNEKEKKRSGGAGVYYHVSYWGRPHDYLWISSTHPSLIREEMTKAYQNGSNRLWVLNVGDIKPAEYNIQLFLDMAYNEKPFEESSYSKKHMYQWHQKIFGEANAKKITDVLWSYYNLAFERRPEFMGWSQTEPTTKTNYTAYNHFSYGDEAQKRIDQYDSLENAVKILRKQFAKENKDAFYQLVYYPVVGASLMNKKFLYRDKAYIYSKQNRISAYYYAAQSVEAYDSIVKETSFYNNQLSGGKWKGMMSMQPRELPVFLAPVLSNISINKSDGWNVIPEGYDTIAYKDDKEKALPAFVAGLKQSYFIDVVLNDSIAVEWKAKPSADWISLSSSTGKLFPKGNQTSSRIWVSIDWKKAVDPKGFIQFTANGKTINVGVNTVKGGETFSSYKGFVEQNKIVSIYAAHYQNKVDRLQSKWQMVEGPGQTNSLLQSIVALKTLDDTPATNSIQQKSAYVEYSFYSLSNELPTLSIYTLPTRPINTNFGVRYAVSVDDAPLQLVSFKTTGRSEQWKQNVLRNAAIKEIVLPRLLAGVHTIKIYTIDPGVILDKMIIRFGDVAKNYGTIPETLKN